MEVLRHIAALALFGAHLLQGILPAAGATCASQPVAAPLMIAAPVPADVPPAVHQHHAAADHATPDRAQTSGGSAAIPTSTPDQHSHSPAACPMAMACTVVGVLSSSVAVSIVDVAIDVHRPVHAADWPVSPDIAPEPPPPRG